MLAIEKSECVIKLNIYDSIITLIVSYLPHFIIKNEFKTLIAGIIEVSPIQSIYNNTQLKQLKYLLNLIANTKFTIAKNRQTPKVKPF